ncbi:MAG: type II toxin-antitoxin system VapC family toxin [Planctomycetes bacterium]|nr:type II toxin-antitoxin system VapC family toxin [Planctomycetota bacterium]
MIILDTDIVTLLHAEHPAVARRLKIEREDIAITIVTLIEVLQGRFDFVMKAATKAQFLSAQKLLRASSQKLEELPTLFLDEGALDQFEVLRSKKGLKRIGRADLLIASIALAKGATLVTRNLKHFRLIPQLKLENWVD